MLLATVLLVSVTITAGLCYWYLQCTRDMQQAQAEVARANMNRTAMQSLLNESIEYSRKNPAMVPVLQKLGMRSRLDTNQPASNSR